jgi:hypothetical protein
MHVGAMYGQGTMAGLTDGSSPAVCCFHVGHHILLGQLHRLREGGLAVYANVGVNLKSHSWAKLAGRSLV